MDKHNRLLFVKEILIVVDNRGTGTDALMRYGDMMRRDYPCMVMAYHNQLNKGLIPRKQPVPLRSGVRTSSKRH